MKFSFFKKREKRIFLDYASGTPLSPSANRAMRPFWNEVWANAGGVYKEGVHAKNVVEEHRLLLARALHVRPDGITFTSGGTESNNLALIGALEARQKKGTPYTDMEVVSTKIEHPSILKVLGALEARGVIVRYAEVDGEGLIDYTHLVSLLSPKTVLVTFAYANSEIGVVQDVKAITRLIRKWNTEHTGSVLVHLDASQAPLSLPCELDRLGVDLMTLDAGKCSGPKGMGVLAHRHLVPLLPIILGGGQEGGLRSGTENTPLIVGGVTAFLEAFSDWEGRSKKMLEVREYAIDQILSRIHGAVMNGSTTERIANNVNFSVPGLDSEYAVIWLDTRGVACATRSACGVKGKDGSHVVREMTGDDARARSTIRISCSPETTTRDIDTFIELFLEYRKLMETEGGVV